MILIDYSNLFNRAVYTSRNEIQQDLGFIAHKICTMILNNVEKFSASKQNPLVIAVDSKPSWRDDYYIVNSTNFPEYENQTYKGDRVKDNSIPWDKIKEINQNILYHLKHYSDFHVVEVPLAEADDIIAVLAKNCLKNKEECWIVSTDRDFVQCQDEENLYIHIYDPVQKIFIPKVNIQDYKMLHIMVAGDDNIKHIAPKLGEKTAKKILPKLQEELQLKPEMKARFHFNQTLIDFEFIPIELQKTILETWDKEEHSYNPKGLNKMFKEYGLVALAQRTINFKLIEETNKKPIKCVESVSTSNSLDRFF